MLNDMRSKIFAFSLGTPKSFFSYSGMNKKKGNGPITCQKLVVFIKFVWDNKLYFLGNWSFQLGLDL